ncbi:hypothetical protein [Peribacillus asahii]|uniref:hypothetical protein n=1 Tax=Peribacillus asahii TaxID=228899 RepID=UPI003828CE87
MDKLRNGIIVGLIAVFLYTEWRYAFRSWDMAIYYIKWGEWAFLLQLQMAIVVDFISNPLVWLFIALLVYTNLHIKKHGVAKKKVNIKI